MNEEKRLLCIELLNWLLDNEIVWANWSKGKISSEDVCNLFLKSEYNG